MVNTRSTCVGAPTATIINGNAHNSKPAVTKIRRKYKAFFITGYPGLGEEEEDPRPHFRLLRSLRDALALPELSMGMSADWRIAIEEGATVIRVGTAIFGARPRKG